MHMIGFDYWRIKISQLPQKQVSRVRLQPSSLFFFPADISSTNGNEMIFISRISLLHVFVSYTAVSKKVVLQISQILNSERARCDG